MVQSTRNEDKRKEIVVSEFLDDNFYKKFAKRYQRIYNKEKQINGVDIEFELDGKYYVCDEKATTGRKYLDGHLKTFCLELSFLGIPSGKEKVGWLIDETKVNDSYLLCWIDRVNDENLTSKESIEKMEICLVRKEKIFEYLSDIGLSMNELTKRMVEIREKGNNANLIIKDAPRGVKFSFSPFLAEQPINILLTRDVYRRISDFNTMIENNEENTFQN